MGVAGLGCEPSTVSEIEIPLVGGNLNDVVRVGDTVRRPTGPHSPAVHSLLVHLERIGFDGAPRLLGIDDKGREVLSWIEGDTIGPQGSPALDDVRAAAALLREVHDATESYDLDEAAPWFSGANDPEGGERIVHGDFAPWNLIVGTNRWSIIDWDMARPGRVVWDTSYAMHTIARLWPGAPEWQSTPLSCTEIVARIEAFAHGYGMDELLLRETLLLVPERSDSIAIGTERLASEGHAAFARLVTDGHPQAWREAAVYAGERLNEWLSALGLQTG
ncbi:MAG: hypothetical protein QOF21_3304 [Actinomycetota bacterium]